MAFDCCKLDACYQGYGRCFHQLLPKEVPPCKWQDNLVHDKNKEETLNHLCLNKTSKAFPK